MLLPHKSVDRDKTLTLQARSVRLSPSTISSGVKGLNSKIVERLKMALKIVK